MKRKVGILGYSGKVGQIVVDILKEKYLLKCGQRSISEDIYMNADDMIEYCKIDIYNHEMLKEFCSDCDILINCTGPSYFTSCKIAEEIQKYETKFVDVFGVTLLNNKRILSNLTGAIGAGNFPGFSAILVSWIAERYGRSIENLSIYAGGKESITTNACVDVLMSMVKNFGKTDRYIFNGSVSINERKANESKLFNIFGRKAYVNEYLTDEIYNAGIKYGIKELHWYNVQINPLYKTVMDRAVMDLAKIKSKDDIYQVAEKIKVDLERSNDDSDNWYKYWIEITLNHGFGKYLENIEVVCGDTYKTNGIIAAMCVEKLLNNQYHKNIYWSFDLLDSEIVIKSLVSNGAITDIKVGNESIMNKLFTEIEEGEI